MSLAIMAVCTRIFSLNYASIDQHVVEVTCRACLPFFEKSLLSAPTYAEQHIGVYKELLEAMGKFRHSFSKDEIQTIKESIRKLQHLLKHTPQCGSNILELALGSIRLVNYRLGQNPGFDFLPYAFRPTSSGSIEEVLSFVETKEKVLISAINDVLQEGPLPEFVYNDTRSLLICTDTLLKAGMPKRAAEIFQLGETIFSVILQRQILSKSFTLDTASDAFIIMQSIALSCAKSFIGTNDKLLADTIIKWKCLFSEFRALLMQFGVGSKYLETFKAIQDIQVKREMSSSDFDAQLIQIAAKHQKEVHQAVCDKGELLLVPLLNDNHELIQSVLKPGQIVLEYCTAHDQDSISRNAIADKKSHGLLLVLQSDGIPVIKSIDFAKAAEYANKWIESAPKYSKDEVLKLNTEICNMLIPEEIQTIISSSHIQQFFICPDPTFALLPFELLPLPSGQKLGEKCTLVYLSAARELLRKSTLNAAQLFLSVMEDSVKQEENTATDDDTQPPIPTQTSQTEASMGPSKKQCLVIGDPNYSLEQTAEKSDPGVLHKLTASMSALFFKPSHESSLACPLPKTRDEANEIEYTLSVAENPLETRCILGDEATVSSVLQVQSPYVLHFSTHGFSRSSKLGVSGTFWDDTKCGLILAGANTYHRGDLEKVTPAAGTGMLTALAVMGMNLYETCLVFLSSCTTARGSVAPNESVNSLAHAFRAAGAQTVVATLWNVLDNEARMFAVHFYHEVCKTGIRPSEALALAKKKMQESGYHWVYWSSFICIGEDVPLFPEIESS